MRCVVLAMVLAGCRGGEKGGETKGHDSRESAETADSSEAADRIVQIADDVAALGPPQVTHREAHGSAVISEDGTTLTGSIDYVQVVNDEVRCAEQIALDGVSPYEGICEDCPYDFDLNFDVDAEVIEEDSIEDCVRFDFFSTLVERDWDIGRNPRLAFASDAMLPYNYGLYRPYEDVLFVIYGASLDDGRYLPGPYYRLMAYHGAVLDSSDADWPDGYSVSATYSDHLLEWSDILDYTYYRREEYDFCHTALNSYATEPYGGDSVTGFLHCDTDQMDGWEIWADEGETVAVTVDDGGKQIDPHFFVNEPDGCGVVFGSYNFECATGYGVVECPSAKFVASTTGTYQIWIYTLGSCARSTTEDILYPYTLLVDWLDTTTQ